MATIKIVVSDPRGTIKANAEKSTVRLQAAISAAANMIASMIETAAQADIAASGNFGSRWTSGIHCRVEAISDMAYELTVTHDEPFAEVFEQGATIKGNPLLWIPLSGTDAEGIAASDYPGGLSSSNRGVQPPLLFSISDKMPKYFGTESVTIPQKWHIDDAVTSVMGNFRQVFDDAWAASG